LETRTTDYPKRIERISHLSQPKLQHDRPPNPFTGFVVRHFSVRNVILTLTKEANKV